MSTSEVRHAIASLPAGASAITESHAAAAGAALSLRLGLGYVFLTFGVEKIVDWHGWSVLFPPALSALVTAWSGLAFGSFLRLLGYVEVVLGLHLVLGLFTRAAATGCALLLVGAVAMMGRTGIGVRDCGLLAMAVAVVLGGAGAWSCDGRRRIQS